MATQRTHDPFGNAIPRSDAPLAPLFALVPCARCAQPCWIRATHPAVDSPFITMRPATTTRGMCAECAAHWWLFTVDGVRWALQESGPELLCLDAVQAQLWRVLAIMCPAIDRLDWGRLRAQWDLPWPDDWALPKDG